MANDYEVLISADVSGMTAAMEEAASSTESAMSDIEAVFEASGSVINDWAAQTSEAAQQSAEGFEQWRAETMGAMEDAAGSIATSTEEIIAELTGVADAARASAAAVAESAAQEAAAMEEAAAKGSAAAEAQAAGLQKAGAGALLLSRAILPLIGISLGASAFKSATDSVTEYAASIQRTAEIMGTSNQEAHAWINAAQLSGVSANAFTTASRTMNAEVASGGKHLKEMGISLRENDGAMKTTGQLIEESINRLESYSASADRNALAQKTLGRGWIDLVTNGQALIANLKQQEQDMSGTGAAQDALVAQGKQLQAVNAQISQSWRNLVSSAGPALIGLLKAVEEALMALTANAVEAAIAIEGVFKVASGLAGVAKGIGEMAPGGGDLTTDQGAIAKGWQDIASSTKAAGDAAQDTGKRIQEVYDRLQQQRGQLWVDHLKMIQGDLADAGTGGEGGGVRGAGLTAAPPVAIPKGGGKGKKGGGGGADPMAGMDDALVSSDNEMKKLNDEFAKMGSESQIVGKASTQSFDQLKQTATTAYSEMKTDYDKWAAAVKSGDVEAAKAFEKDWKDATKAFQQAFDQAKQKAQQDMQQIKSTADQISSEISSVLNSAISGKLNWQQEFEKILEKMLSSLIKYLTHMAVMWVSHESQVLATQVSGGAAGLAAQKANNAQAGMSDAATAAKGAYSSAAQIPYIGWIIAPFAAAAAFAGVEAFGSAAGGAVIPPGVNPMLQLHENEMVLPAQHSDTIKRLGAMGTMGGSGNTANISMHMQSLDPRTMADIFHANAPMITNAVARGLRGGINPYTG